VSRGPDIHPTAIVHESAVIGDCVSIGPYSIVEAGARIGVGTDILAYCLIGAGAIIGKHCHIGSYTEIRKDCVLGVRVRLGSKCLLADGTMIGNDSHCSGTFTTCNKPEPGQHNPAVMGQRFYAGVGVVIMPNVVILDDVKVGASSTVFCPIPSGETWIGVPARKL
jgi:UDP-3-O-[3-hydroxymyristoyl] glucosamine N-acyltransferase